MRTKDDLRARLVKLLRHTQTERGMTVMRHESRCIRAGEVHELVTTDHTNLIAGERVDRVGFIGFMEATNAGVLERGDFMFIGGEPVGTVVGFDDCHFPNHYNILIGTKRLLTSDDISLAQVGASVLFKENT